MINPYLDTAIGVAVVYLLFSILAYVAQEFWAAIRNSRGRMLQKAVFDLLNDNLNKAYGALLFEHPQFKFLKKTADKLPSYLPAANFSDALIDLIGREAKTSGVLSSGTEEQIKNEMAADKEKTNIDTTGIALKHPGVNDVPDMYTRFSEGLQNMNDSNLKILLQNALAHSKSLPQLKYNLEGWYNNYMDRVTGWYKDIATVNLRWIGIIIAIIFNVHALNIISTVYSDRQLRDKLVETSGNMTDNSDVLKSIYTSSVQSNLAEIDSNCTKQMLLAASDAQRQTIQQKCAEKRLAVADSFAALRRTQMNSITDSLKLWDLPVGWKTNTAKGSAAEATGNTSFQYFRSHWLWLIFGWILSGFAMSAGAPFWFELLCKFINVRRAGLRPATQPKDDSSK